MQMQKLKRICIAHAKDKKNCINNAKNKKNLHCPCKNKKEFALPVKKKKLTLKMQKIKRTYNLQFFYHFCMGNVNCF